ncbi:MAG: hypothetical protein ACYSUT_07970 [Planctomycetota bacterium]|jgi:hypothetical protein
MNQKKYSESKIKTAQKFLSKYDLSFNILNESQKKSVVRHTQGRKYLLLCLVTYIFGMTVCVIGAYLYYARAQTGIDKIVELSASGEAINLRKYGVFCFEKGLLVGMSCFSALYILMFTIILPLIMRQKRQILNAFLPALKQPPINDNEEPNN